MILLKSKNLNEIMCFVSNSILKSCDKLKNLFFLSSNIISFNKIYKTSEI